MKKLVLASATLVALAWFAEWCFNGKDNPNRPHPIRRKLYQIWYGDDHE